MTGALEQTTVTAPAIAPAALETSAEPIAATKLWCPVCRRAKKVSHKPVQQTSRQFQRGMHGEHLVCEGCSTTIATCFVEEE